MRHTCGKHATAVRQRWAMITSSVVLCVAALGCDMNSAPLRSSHDLEPEPFTANEHNDTAHVSEWRVARGDSITLPIVPASSNSFTVDWGDGTVEKFTDTLAEHTYVQKDTYTVKITGTAVRWSFLAIPQSRHKILAVANFGALGWKNLDGAFWQATSLTQVAGGDVSEVSSMRMAFAHATNTELDIANWDTKNVEDMSGMFAGALRANPDVRNWDVSAVINMAGMFANTSSAQPDVSEWNVRAVEDMSAMFAGATAANPAVGKWDTANVRDLRAMFKGAIAANPDVSDWDIGKVARLDYMFADAVVADPNVSKWDTGNVLSMQGLFSGAMSANPDVFSWDTSRVTTLAEMFKNAVNASPLLMCWNVANVIDMRSMFAGALNVDPDLSKWSFASAIFMQDMFHKAQLSTDNYTALLKQLATTVKRRNVIFDAGNSKYNCRAETARQQLVAQGWLINDAGSNEPCENKKESEAQAMHQ